MIKVTSHGIEQIIGGKKLVAAGLQIELLSISVNESGHKVAHLSVYLVDDKGGKLAQIGTQKSQILAVGDTATILDLDKAFDITIAPS